MRGINSAHVSFWFKVRSNTLPTNECKARGRPERPTACPLCGHPKEDLAHCLMECPSTADSRVELLEFLAKHQKPLGTEHNSPQDLSTGEALLASLLGLPHKLLKEAIPMALRVWKTRLASAFPSRQRTRRVQFDPPGPGPSHTNLSRANPEGDAHQVSIAPPKASAPTSGMARDQAEAFLSALHTQLSHSSPFFHGSSSSPRAQGCLLPMV